jgi:hypothetical protein
VDRSDEYGRRPKSIVRVASPRSAQSKLAGSALDRQAVAEEGVWERPARVGKLQLKAGFQWLGNEGISGRRRMWPSFMTVMMVRMV